MTVYARQTVKTVVMIEGIGLHSGNSVEVTIHPGSGGIWFRRGAERVQALPEHVTDTALCTRLGAISTIEHCMSALAALEITDVEIELNSPELPALGGGSFEYCEAISRAGVEVLGEFQLEGPFARVYAVGDNEKIAVGFGSGHWRYNFSSPDRYPFEQSYESLQVNDDYVRDISKARTFGWKSDLERIQSMGLAKGLSLENALLLDDSGPVNQTHYPDEPARHKLLDAIGDLYLAGAPIRHLNFVGDRSGHRLNVEAAAKLRAALKFG